jgi:lactate dehydrogenase-like 2-hydroxyacid dehydrogenase
MEVVCLDACHCPVPAFDIRDHKYVEYSTTNADEIDQRIENASIVITTRVRLDGSSLAKCKNLKLIAVMAAGTEIIDRAACKLRGIVVCNIPSASVESVAEHAFALYFAAKRKIVELHNLTLRGDVWPVKRTAIHVYDGLPATCRKETLGIIGYGNFGEQSDIYENTVTRSNMGQESVLKSLQRLWECQSLWLREKVWKGHQDLRERRLSRRYAPVQYWS